METNQVTKKIKNLSVLFVLQKWPECNPSMGELNNMYDFIGSFKASCLGNYDSLFYDEYYYYNQAPADEELLNKCKNSQPRLIVLSWHPQDFSGKNYNISLETLYQIKNDLKISIISIWCDSVLPMVMNKAELLLPFCELNIVIDSKACLKNASKPEKYLYLHSPKDPVFFYNHEMNRDIDINFVGSVNLPHLLERQPMINALRNSGLSVYQAGGQRQDSKLTIEQYARIHMRSKISLNFSKTAYGLAQVKGRVFEATLCGAMLLEQENSETTEFFEPMIDYVPFTNEQDLVGKAKYYLEHDSERLEIARRGHNKAKEKYTGELFWKTIFSKLSINLESESLDTLVLISPVRPEDLVYQLERSQRELDRSQISLHQTHTWLQQTQAELERLNDGYASATLIEDFGRYNIIVWQGKYYGLPKKLGAIDVMIDDMSELKGVFVDISIERLKRLIQNHLDLIAEIEGLHLEIDRSHSQIQEMESSKFLKLRSLWLRLKQIIS